MSDAPSRGSLGPLTIIAALVLILAAAAYVAMTQGDDLSIEKTAAPVVQRTSPGVTAAASSAPPALNSAATDSAALEEGPKGPAQPARSVPPAGILNMASAPKVTPESDSDAVLAALDALLPKLKSCAAQWVERHPDATGKAFFVFHVGEKGHPENWSLQFKGVRDEAVDTCFTAVVGAAVLPGEGAKVFWPVVVGGSAVVAPLSQTAE